MSKLSFFSRFVVRTPAFPCNEIDQILSSPNCFSVIIENPDFAEAVYIASQSLYNKIYQGNNANKAEKDIKRIQSSIVKYFSRMCMRSTPFGLFAACSIGRFSSENQFFIKSKVSRVARLDHSVLCKLLDFVVNSEDASNSKINFFTNTSLYQISAHKARYIEPSQFEEFKRQYLWEEILLTPYLKDVLILCREGTTLSILSDFIEKKYGIEATEAMHYLHELVSSKIIVPELYHVVTGKDYLSRIIDLPIESEGLLKKTLYSLKQNLLNTKSVIILHSSIQKELKAIGLESSGNNLIQIDLVRNTSEFFIGEEIQRQITEVFYLLSAISPEKQQNKTMEDFKRKFTEVYQTQEVPLVLALDPDLGIGYPVGETRVFQSSILDYVKFPWQNAEKKSTAEIKRFLENEVYKNASKDMMELDVTDVLESLRNDDKNSIIRPLSHETFFTKIKLLRRENSGDLLIELSSFQGSSALNLINRFAHTSDEMMDLCEEIAFWENGMNDGSCLIAEIAHLPEDRTGNVVYRPLLRRYEIPYISCSSASFSDTLGIEDLYISIVNNKLRIRSKRLNKWIIPRLSNAHNFAISKLPIYRFLCDSQFESSDIRAFFPKPSSMMSSSFIPRIRYKNILLSLATWRINKKDIEHIINIEDEQCLLYQVTQWREANNIPSRILLCQGDNELYVNLSIPNSIRAFLDSIKTDNSFVIKEFSYPNSKSAIRDENGKSYQGEIFMFFKMTE